MMLLQNRVRLAKCCFFPVPDRHTLTTFLRTSIGPDPLIA